MSEQLFRRCGNGCGAFTGEARYMIGCACQGWGFVPVAADAVFAEGRGQAIERMLDAGWAHYAALMGDVGVPPCSEALWRETRQPYMARLLAAAEGRET